MTNVHGHVEEGWGRVADVFESHFDRGLESGASCAVYVDGRSVVDIWAGIAEPSTGRPWTQDTVAVTFSTSKGATAICAAMLVERGALDVDAPVARYWPEFAAAGKGEVSVRWLLSHQAGLPVVDDVLTTEELCAWEPMIEALERQEPAWTPGTAYGYHALTFGYLVGEVIRRITGRSAGRFFQEEVAEPLGLDAWIGLPEGVEPRVARLEAVPPSAEWMEVMSNFTPDALDLRAASLNGAIPDLTAALITPEFHAAEFPAANLVTNASSLARMYAATVSDVDGVRLLSPATVAAVSAVQTTGMERYGWPKSMPPTLDQHFALGFMTPAPVMPHLGPRSFGHAGAGGSLGLADPDRAVGFGYVMNRLVPGGIKPRPIALVAAVDAVMGAS